MKPLRPHRTPTALLQRRHGSKIEDMSKALHWLQAKVLKVCQVRNKQIKFSHSNINRMSAPNEQHYLSAPPYASTTGMDSAGTLLRGRLSPWS